MVLTLRRSTRLVKNSPTMWRHATHKPPVFYDGVRPERLPNATYHADFSHENADCCKKSWCDVSIRSRCIRRQFFFGIWRIWTESCRF